MSQFIKMGEISMKECHALKELIVQKDQMIFECNSLQKQNKAQYEQVKSELSKIEKEIKNLSKQLLMNYKIEIIPGANIRIDFDTGNILAVLPDKKIELYYK